MAKSLAASGSNDDEGDATDERDTAQDGWNGNGAGLLVLDVQGANLSVLMFVGEAEASYGEADDADEDEDGADDGCGFHARKILLSVLNSAGEMQICTEGWMGALTCGRHAV